MRVQRGRTITQLDQQQVSAHRDRCSCSHDSLHSRLLTLPAELEIYPGHQAGSASGAGLSGKPALTLGFERRFNPMLALSRDDFIASLTAEIPATPADMARIVEANLRGVAPEMEHA
jgi:hydroxyacylglutathione hydrolase